MSEELNPFSVSFTKNEWTNEMRFAVSFNGEDVGVRNDLEWPLQPNVSSCTNLIAAVMNRAWNTRADDPRIAELELSVSSLTTTNRIGMGIVSSLQASQKLLTAQNARLRDAGEKMAEALRKMRNALHFLSDNELEYIENESKEYSLTELTINPVISWNEATT